MQKFINKFHRKQTRSAHGYFTALNFGFNYFTNKCSEEIKIYNNKTPHVVLVGNRTREE